MFYFRPPEYWEGHEYVREIDRNCEWRLVEILANQFGETYWKDEPFAVRNCAGENYNTYDTVEKALIALANIHND